MDEIITEFGPDSSIPSLALAIQDATGASKFWCYRAAHLQIKQRVPSPTTSIAQISYWMERAKHLQYSQEIMDEAVKILTEIREEAHYPLGSPPRP